MGLGWGKLYVTIVPCGVLVCVHKIFWSAAKTTHVTYDLSAGNN